MIYKKFFKKVIMIGGVSFSSAYRQIIFWSLFFSDQKDLAGQVIVGFLAITLIKSIFESVSYGFMQIRHETKISFAGAAISPFLLILAWSFGFVSNFLAPILIFACLCESIISICMTYYIRDRLDLFSVFLALVIFGIGIPLAFIFYLNSMTYIFLLILFFLLLASLSILKALHHIPIFSFQGIISRKNIPFYFSTPIGLLNSNLYKLVTVSFYDAKTLASIYSVVSLFIVLDVIAAGLKHISFKDRKIMHVRSALKLYLYNNITYIIFVSIVTVLIYLKGWILLDWYFLLLIFMAKLFDGYKGILKSQAVSFDKPKSAILAPVIALILSLPISLYAATNQVNLAVIIFISAACSAGSWKLFLKS